MRFSILLFLLLRVLFYIGYLDSHFNVIPEFPIKSSHGIRGDGAHLLLECLKLHYTKYPFALYVCLLMFFYLSLRVLMISLNPFPLPYSMAIESEVLPKLYV